MPRRPSERARQKANKGPKSKAADHVSSVPDQPRNRPPTKVPGIDNLKHLVVLMMCSRSFDHMLGFLQNPQYLINGLTGGETNQDSAGTTVQVSSDANYVGDLMPDPGHSHLDTLTQLYVDPNTPVVQAPTMSGFVRSYEARTGNPQAAHRIMRCFSPQKLPVLTTLAQQFCVCDHWFASVPGPTFPNRAFAHAATSMGRVDMGIDWRNLTKTIYERLAEYNLSSVIYYHDSTLASTFNGLAGNPDFFGSFEDDFLPACADNDLPAYSFLEPRFANFPGGDGQPAFSASDQHPDHNVREGEALIQTVFRAIWGNPKVRDSTLLVIVYDQHGGIYDHVSPPTTVNPDGKVWTGGGGLLDPPFDFTRLGVRVPAILISPFIPAGTIDHTIYDHSSVIATARKLFLPNWQDTSLTMRDKVANTFEYSLSLSQPRTDDIILAGAIAQPPTAAQLAQPVNDHLKMLVRQVAMMAGDDPDKITTSITTEAQASAYLQSGYTKIHSFTPRRTSAKEPSIESSVSPSPQSLIPPEALLPGFSPENLTGQDLIGITHDVNAFASVMSAQDLNPPLAIGLFADWGSGKSFFMRKLKERIEHIGTAAFEAKRQGRQSSYCTRIVQIEFNAWHYVEGNLWASLVEHIFENLRVSSKEPSDLVELRRKEALENLELSKELKAKAQQQYESAEAGRKAAEEKVNSAKKARDNVSSDLSRILARDVWQEVKIPDSLKDKVHAAMDELGFARFAESARELHAAIGDTKTLIGRGRALLLSAFNAPGWWKRIIVLIVLILAVPVLGSVAIYLLDALHWYTIQGKESIAKAIQLATLVGGVATWLRTQVKRASKALNVVESANRWVDEELDNARKQKQKEVDHLEKELENRRRELGDANRQLADAEQKVASAQAELNAATPTRILAEFIESRAASADYRRHLGIIALIRKDFETLTRLMRQRRSVPQVPGEEDDPLGIDRIILYIDDLDRCPPKRVVQVLEAIHLLLAFDLFVVVVGVDSRWVARSLLEQYPLLAPDDIADAKTVLGPNHPITEGGASPLDYLEKIFQIPFWLHRMSPDACGRLIEGLVGPGVFAQLPDPQALPSTLAPTPEPTASTGTVVGRVLERPVELPPTLESTTPPGVVASQDAPQPKEPSPAERIDLEPKSLRLQHREVEFMKTLTPILSRSPRATKRFLNTYRIVRASLPSEKLAAFTDATSEGMDDQAVMFLLSVLTGAQSISNDFFECLFRQPPSSSSKDLSSALEARASAPGSSEIRAIRAWLSDFDKREGRSLPLGLLQEWAPYIMRYSFRMALNLNKGIGLSGRSSMEASVGIVSDPVG